MKRLILIFILFWSTSLFAVNMTSLYEAELPVSAQTEEAKEEAVTKGFMQVLFKLSGSSDIYDNPTIKSAMKRANYYVLEYSYSQASTSSSEYLINIKYHPDDINRLLMNAQVPYWGQVRPLILTWLVYVPLGKEPEIIGNDKSFLSMLVKFQSKKYGLPLILPMMDMTDLNLVSTKEVANFDYSALSKAGARYEPDAILIGTIDESARGFQSQWHFVLGGESWDWAISDKYLKDVVKTLFTQATTTLAKFYIQKNTTASKLGIQLEVSNIEGKDQLQELMKYLNLLTSVEQVDLLQVVGNKAILAVTINGTMASFQKNADIDGNLKLLGKDLNKNKLIYSWVN